MAWPTRKQNGHAATSSTPITGESASEPTIERTWKRIPVIVAVLVALGGLGTWVYASGQSMERKATKVDLEAVRHSLADAHTRARAEYDARLDRLEQERADHAATLRAISDRLQSIDRKLDRIDRPTRRTP